MSIGLTIAIDVTGTYVDRSVPAYNSGELTPVDAAKGKWYVSELCEG
ncbi:hypothetical protein MCNF_43370 [Mycolicibacterium confluentis]|uniref:Uncharacterized protein n=1 Tax=Mycolicibacterium confluentis TaxID=28047 RepID=A0A7I7Y3Z4_9MYCO|nr:hypothetical protein MCNF_43370 [Mycolicibacterium confluentis]